MMRSIYQQFTNNENLTNVETLISMQNMLQHNNFRNLVLARDLKKLLSSINTNKLNDLCNQFSTVSPYKWPIFQSESHKEINEIYCKFEGDQQGLLYALRQYINTIDGHYSINDPFVSKLKYKLIKLNEDNTDELLIWLQYSLLPKKSRNIDLLVHYITEQYQLTNSLDDNAPYKLSLIHI